MVTVDAIAFWVNEPKASFEAVLPDGTVNAMDSVPTALVADGAVATAVSVV